MIVTPISKKAREIFLGVMGGSPEINVIAREGRKVLFASKNGKYCAWVNLAGDKHWNVIIRPSS